MSSPNLTQTRALADAVGLDHAELEDSAKALREANGALLAANIDALAGALRALCSAVGVAGELSGAGYTVENAPWRGLYLAGDGPTVEGRVAAGPHMRGRHGGARLFLDERGDLVEMTYSGPWSNVPGEVSRWKTTHVYLTYVEAAEKYGLATILDRLAAALAEQAGGASRVTAARLREKAERVLALVKLVRSWR
jgi:hypothetical protein